MNQGSTIFPEIRDIGVCVFPSNVGSLGFREV